MRQALGQGGHAIVKNLQVLAPVVAKVQDLDGVDALLAVAREHDLGNDALDLHLVRAALDGKLHLRAQAQLCGVVQEDTHVVLGELRGHALKDGPRIGAAQRADALEHPDLGKSCVLDLDILAVRVTPVGQEEAHAQEVEVANQPEQQDEKAHQPRRGRLGQKPDDPRDARQRERHQHDEGRQAAPVRDAARGRAGLVGHLEGRKRDAQRFLDYGHQQVRHDGRLVDAAPAGGDAPLAHHTKTHGLRHKHGQPKDNEVQPAAVKHRYGKHSKEKRREKIN